MLSYKENFMKVVRFERPDYIPMTFSLAAACYDWYPQDQLFDLMEGHPLLFPNFVRPKGHYQPVYALKDRKDEPYTDDFGCLWTTSMNGITGTVTGHPLADWNAFETYQAPNPEICSGIGPLNWEDQAKDIAQARKEGKLVRRGLRHGHTFLQLCDLRGYQNLLFDMIDEDERLPKLIHMVEEFNFGIVKRYVDLGIDIMCYAEDLGMQTGPMLSPELFRTYIKPSYKRLIQYAKDRDVIIHMHSDGDIRTLVDDLFDGGVQIVNLQDLVNGIDWIADNLAGKHCIELDIDRQKITVNGTPKDVEDLVREEVTKIGRRDGGLAMIYGLYPGTPLENAGALMDAMEKYMFYFD